MEFNKVAFDGQFNVKLNNLRNAERTTRAELLDLSRQVWQAFHLTEDVSYINRILDVLTPINKKVAIEFFKEFSGFRFDKDTGLFGKKDKKHYDDKKAIVIEWLTDPLNNIWSWAERNIKIEKDFTFETMQKQAESLLKKADKNGFKKHDVLKAIMQAGLTVDDLITFMGTLEEVELNVQD